MVILLLSVLIKRMKLEELSMVQLNSECDNDKLSEWKNGGTSFVTFTAIIGRHFSKSDIDSDNEKIDFEFLLNKFNTNGLDDLFIYSVGYNSMLLVEETKLNDKLKTNEKVPCL